MGLKYYSSSSSTIRAIPDIEKLFEDGGYKDADEDDEKLFEDDDDDMPENSDKGEEDADVIAGWAAGTGALIGAGAVIGALMGAR